MTGAWALVLVEFIGSSAGDGITSVARVVGVVISDGGRRSVLAVTPTGSAITTLLGTVTFTFPASAVPRRFVVVLVATVSSTSSTVEVVVLKSVMLEGDSAVVTRALLGSSTTFFWHRRSFLMGFGSD